ncbi:MAG: hypothetical protein C0506_09270 [Anaerolinea sp.]|nr:hypothetical protein [Anaerolinea sp.]
MQLTEFNAPAQADLIAKVQSGDGRAFGRIYDDTFEQVHRYAFTLTRCREDAEDLTAETYERALRGIGRYESRDVPILIWLLRIARNVARERAAKYYRQPLVTVAQDQLDQFPDVSQAVEETFLWEAVLQDLTPAQRDVIALRLAGLRGREIAETLGKAEGTIKALQFAAIRNLRRTVSR